MSAKEHSWEVEERGEVQGTESGKTKGNLGLWTKDLQNFCSVRSILTCCSSLAGDAHLYSSSARAALCFLRR